MIRSILKWTGIVLGSVIVLFVAAVFVRANRTFEGAYPKIAAVTDSSVIARGKHLVTGPADRHHVRAAKILLEP